MPALALQEAFKAAEKKQLKLSLPVTTRWNTYNEMLRRLIYSKDQINSAIWSQIILNMKSKKADDLQQIFCRTNFWQLADDLFKMSDPIAKTITQIEGYICRCWIFWTKFFEGNFVTLSQSYDAVEECLLETKRQIMAKFHDDGIVFTQMISVLNK